VRYCVRQLFQQYVFLQLTALTIAGGLFFLVRPGSLLWRMGAADEDADKELLEVQWADAMCRRAGWVARCQITGERNLLQPATAVGLDVTLAFEQGAVDVCSLLRPSRLLEPSGRWRFDEAADGRSVVEWRIRCSSAIRSGDEVLVPAGTVLFFAATIAEAEADDAGRRARRAAALQGVADTAGLQLTDGRVSVLKGSGPWGPELNLATGATELVQVGTFGVAAAATRRDM